MNRWMRFTGLTLAIALSFVALPSRAAVVRFCYCEIYCSDGSVIFGQAQNRYDCAQFFRETCGGSGTWVCQYE